ncbi:MAG TPA: MOSC domain-containing protein [Ilumatobacter sp.]|nr:MOSC domain-containing protein [Ilumatobacter sp.]
MAALTQRSTHELDGLLDDVRSAPADAGEVQLIVARPGVGEREALDTADLDTAIGLVGDNWFVRGSSSTTDGTAHPEAQLTIMNARAADAVAGGRANWALAGDQIYADLDISHENLPAGTRLRVGTAVVEVSVKPHTGCAKFTQRFGLDAMRWVNSPDGKQLRLRGVNCRVVEPGRVTLGDPITKL